MPVLTSVPAMLMLHSRFTFAKVVASAARAPAMLSLHDLVQSFFAALINIVPKLFPLKCITKCQGRPRVASVTWVPAMLRVSRFSCCVVLPELTLVPAMLKVYETRATGIGLQVVQVECTWGHLMFRTACS